MSAEKHENEEKMRWEIALPQPAALEVVKVEAPPMDAEAFAGFYARAARPLWAYLARTSADPALAEDLMQESFVRFLASDRFADLAAEGEVAARRYLFRIGSNLLRDHWRRPRTEALEAASAECFATDEAAQASDSRLLLGPALAQLRPRDRQLLWLAYAEGYSHKEIAEITGLAGASVRLLLYRARHRLARLLQKTEKAQAETGKAQAQPNENHRGLA